MVAETELMVRINGSAKKALEEFDKLNKKSKETQKVLGALGKGAAVAFTALAVTVVGATKAYANYETALVGVGKTTDISGDKLKNFGKEFQSLSKEIPITTNELLGIAQAAGQLGVKGEKDLLLFTKTIAKLGVATDLTGEQAATSLTRILNVTKEGIGTIETFGSVIVALGNNFAASESEIVRMTNELSRSTAVFGVSAAEAAALGTAMKSVGIQAQLGGSVVGKSMLKIQKAISGGGKSFKLLEKITGLTGDKLKQTFKKDATGVFKSFLEGLNNLEGGSDAVFASLEQLGLRGDEVNKVLPVLAKNADLVGQTLAVANKEVNNATALNKEAAVAFSTLNSNLTRTGNTLTNAAVIIGEKLAPTINSLLNTVQDVANAISEADSDSLAFVATLLKWATIAAGVIAGAAAFALGVIKLSAGIAALGAAFLPASIAASAFWVAVTGPVGLTVAGLAAVSLGLVTLASNIQKTKQMPKTLEEINKQLDRLEKKRSTLSKTSIRLGGGPQAVAEVDKEIKKLEELRKKKIATSKDFGTGSLLIKPEADVGTFKTEDFGLDGQEIPLKKKKDLDEDDRLESLKKQSIKLQNIRQESSNAEAEVIREGNAVIAAENRKASAEELEILQQRDKVKKAQILATNEEDITVKKALEERTAIHQAKLGELQAQFDADQLEKGLASAEQKAELDIAAKEAGIELEQEYNELEREALEEKIITEDEARAELKERRLGEEIQRRNQYIADEVKHGETIAKINNILNNKHVKDAGKAANDLIALTNSKNDTLKSIGKAAALVRIGIDTAQGAISAYTSLSGIPIVGPALGLVAAGALTAYGVERAAEVTGAQGGALVTGGKKGVDSELFSLGKGELVAPDKSFDEVVEGVAAQRGFTKEDEGGTSKGNATVTVVIEPKDDLINFIQQQIVEAELQNTGV